MDQDLRQEVLKSARKRRRKRIAAIVSGICSTIITIFIIIAFCQIYVDRLTIKTTESRLCLTLDQKNMSTYLEANPLLKITDTQYSDIPEDIEEGMGNKSTYYYLAYSFYLGTQDIENELSYKLNMTLENVTKELDEIVKVMLIQDGHRRIYAKPKFDEVLNEYYTEPIYYGDRETKVVEGVSVAPERIAQFNEGNYIITTSGTLQPGEYYKYTVVMWIDGWESTDDQKGGTFLSSIEFSTKFD